MIKKRFDIKDEKSVKPTGSVYRHLEDGVAIFSSWVSANIQVTLWQFRTRVPRQLPLPHLRLRLPDRQAGHLPHDGRARMRQVTEQRTRRLLRRAARQADRDRVRRDNWSRKNTIRIVVDGLGVTPPDGREGRRGELQGAGTGHPVGGDRRAAARLVAAAEPSPAVRRPAAGARADAGDQTASRSSRSSPWPMPSGSSATSLRRAFRRAGDRRGRQAVPRPREGQAGREVTRSSRRCASASRPCWCRRTSCSCARSPASSTTSPWPAGCRTSCGVRCPTRNCSRSPNRAS